MWVLAEENFKLFNSYEICTYGSDSLGPKTSEGDGLAPEGFYFVRPEQLNPWSSFHLSFNIGYPNQYDRAQGWTGGAIMVHGECVSIGCFAMTNNYIDEIYTIADAAFRNSQPFFRVHIFPFKMNSENMNSHNQSNWKAFRENLKEDYDFFDEHNKKPPNVRVQNRRYIFDAR